MHMLLAFQDEALAEYLSAALRRNGVDSSVFNEGVGPDGQPIFAISCFKATELARARYLIYSSSAFIADISTEAADELRELRRQSRAPFMALMTSKPALLLGGMALVIAALGYLLGF